MDMVPVAQLAERQIVALEVVGSNPIGHPVRCILLSIHHGWQFRNPETLMRHAKIDLLPRPNETPRSSPPAHRLVHAWSPLWHAGVSDIVMDDRRQRRSKK
jgi:hypothetical protein